MAENYKQYWYQLETVMTEEQATKLGKHIADTYGVLLIKKKKRYEDGRTK